MDSSAQLFRPFNVPPGLFVSSPQIFFYFPFAASSTASHLAQTSCNRLLGRQLEAGTDAWPLLSQPKTG